MGFESFNNNPKAPDGEKAQIIDMVKNADGSFEMMQGKNEPTNSLEKNSSNEITTANAEIEVGILVSGFFDMDVREYGKSKNVEVNFFIEKELPLSKIYKVEFKGQRRDIQAVVDYIKSKKLS